MKKIFICVLLLTAMLTCTLPVHAVEAEITVEVLASKTEVQVGDTIEYTILATGSGVTAMQFQVMLPEGLSYVPNSGATPDQLAQKLGVPAADWTEISMMFTFYNDIGITFAKGTEILRFSCVAEKEGTWNVQLYELLPFDGEFNEFPPTLQVQLVHVVSEGTNPPASVETTEPVDVTEPTEEPDRTDPDKVTDPTFPEGEATIPEDGKDTLTTGTEETSGQETNPTKPTKPVKNEDTSCQAPWIWIGLGCVAVAVVAAVVLVLFKKKRS